MTPRTKQPLSAEPNPYEMYHNLMSTLEKASEPTPRSLLKAVKQLPEQPSLPPLPQAWSLINFVANEERRSWGEATIDWFLEDESEIKIAVEEGKQLQGRIPGQPDWQFDICNGDDPILCTLRNRTTGEVIDLLIPGQCRKEAEFPGRYRDEDEIPGNCRDEDDEIYSSIESGSLEWQLKNIVLNGRGRCVGDAEAIRLASLLPRYSAAIRSFHQRWQDEGQRFWLAALLGDWLNAHAAALLLGHKPLIAEIERRAKKSYSQKHLLRLRDSLFQWSDWDCRWALQILTQHKIRYVHDILKATFRGNPKEYDPAALPLIVEEDLPGWEEEVRRWFLARRVSVTADEINAGLYLASRDVCIHKVVELLIKRVFHEANWWHLFSALVVARFDVRLAEGLFRQGLGSDSDRTVILALAALAVSDWPWANGLLNEAPRGLESPLTKAACRLALSRRSGTKAPAARMQRKKREQPFLLVKQGAQKVPLYYLGTVEELFEDAVEEVLQCQATLDRRLGRQTAAGE